VQVFTVFTREFCLVGRPIQSSLAIQIGDILLWPGPGFAIVFSDPVGPGAGMTIGAVIDHLLVAMNPVNRWIGKLGGDLRHLFPGYFRSSLLHWMF
jgi:hypothetical protein